MMHEEVTIYDIAEKLSISPSTVSRALNASSAVSKKTQKKIIAMAETMGYRSNTFAANLHMQRSNTIGVIVPRLNSYFISEVIAGVESMANDSCAAACMNELKRLGFKIPQDFVFTGFNNDMISRNIDPSLTTVDYPGFEMGKVIAIKLLDHLSKKLNINSSSPITIKSELVVRSSSQYQA